MDNYTNPLGTPEEWKELNFRCGLEIHHQIKTDKKLFCHCPAGQFNNEWHAEAVRHMRPTLSELGEYDGTALMEFKTRKEIIYRLNRNNVCTYEMDDNPPFLINDQAVDIALTIALALKCKIVGELHIIRKQYLDGSIPAGFQRTAIIGVDGEITLSNGKNVRIIQLGLEEDACREISDNGHTIVFATDRLSMPIIEVVTDSNLNTPEEAADAGRRISRLLRATQLVRRGIGAGRQDVNVSIAGSTRVEIKGVPRIPRIPMLTALEARRQKALLEIRAELQKRGYKAGDRPGTVHSLNGQRGEILRPEIAAALLANDSVQIINFPKLKGILAWPMGDNRRTFADEISGRIRVVACLDQLPNLMHTDGNGGLDSQDVHKIKEAASSGNEDSAVVIWGPEDDVKTAVNEVIDRIQEAISGVPNETRQALRNNSTDFERLLPGPDRMYPDTDSPPFEVTDDRIAEAAKLVPVNPWVREEKYQELGLSEDMIDRLAISEYANLFDRLVDDKKVDPVRAAEVLTRHFVCLRRKGFDISVLSHTQIEELLVALGSDDLYREGLWKVLETWFGNPSYTLAKVFETMSWKTLNSESVNDIIEEAFQRVQKMTVRNEENVVSLVMGFAMREIEGRFEGKQVLEKIKNR